MAVTMPMCAPRRGLKPRGQEQPSDRARRDTDAQFQQFASNPRVTPARILPCHAQNELTHSTFNRMYDACMRASGYRRKPEDAK